MKGQIPIIVVGLVASLAIWGVIVANLFGEFSTIQGTYVDTSIVSAINSISFARRSLDQALVYSFYQSAYEIAKNGGYKLDATNLKTIDSTVYWNFLGDTSQVPVSGVFYSGHAVYNTELSNLQDRILSVLNSYVLNLHTTDLDIPYYNSIIATSDMSYVNLTAQSSGILELKDPKNLYDVKDTANLNKTVITNFEDLFKLARNNFIAPGDVVKNKIVSVIQLFINNYDATTATSTASEAYCPAINPSGPTDEQIFTDTYGKNYQQMHDAIDNGLIKSLENFNVQANFPEKTTTSVVSHYVNVALQQPCSITPSMTACHYDNNGNPDSYLTTKICTYSYTASAIVKVAIQSLNDYYPVYNGTETSFKNLELNFALASCNIYDQTACNLS